MKTTLMLMAALVGCIDQSEQLGDTDQAIDSRTRDRVFSLGQGGTVWSLVQTAANQSTFTNFDHPFIQIVRRREDRRFVLGFSLHANPAVSG